MPDVMNWTALFVALSPLLVALLRREGMSDNLLAALTVATVSACFFAGRALDGALTWPLEPGLAAQLAAALGAQQVLYMVLKKTSPMQALERMGNEGEVQ